MSLLEADEVAPARSPFSHRSTERPRPTASRAIPTPLTPPPTMRRSRGADGRDGSAGIRLPRRAADSLTMGDIDTARDDQGSTAPGPHCGQRIENQVPEERRPDDLTVSEWRQKRGGAAHQASDEKILPARAHAGHARHHEPLIEARRPPHERQRHAAEDEPYHRRIKQGGERLIGMAHPPRDDDAKRPTYGRTQRQQRRDVKGAAAGANDDEDADKAHRHCRPAPRTNLFAEKRNRKCRDEERRGKGDGGRIRERQADETGDE